MSEAFGLLKASPLLRSKPHRPLSLWDSIPDWPCWPTSSQHMYLEVGKMDRKLAESLQCLSVTLAATSQVLYGQIYWNPLEMIQVWDNRPAKSIAALL